MMYVRIIGFLVNFNIIFINDLNNIHRYAIFG